MNIKERIEKDLKHWKANAEADSNTGDRQPAIFSEGMVNGLELALSYFERPSNKVDADRCSCGLNRTKYKFRQVMHCLNCNKDI